MITHPIEPMLRRLGKKTRLLPTLLDLFPKDIMNFIDLFFGTGAVSFAMLPRVKKIIANDHDWNVMNLFLVMKDRQEELVQAVASMPEHGALFDYWKTHEENDPIWQACRFLMLSNFGYMGQMSTMHYRVHAGGLAERSKQRLLEALQNGIQHQIASPKITYMCKDFREVLSSISFNPKTFGRPADAKAESFLYCDPPYCQTTNNYQRGFTPHDTQDLFDVCITSGLRFAISEFETPFITELADRHDLHVTHVKERRTLKSRNIEILITNYTPERAQLRLGL